MPTQPIRAASVGLGRWSRVIAKAAARSDLIRIVSCYDVIPESMSAFAKEIGCDQTSSYEDLLSDDRIEAILCTTPNHMHLETISQAAAAGKHVYTEKPIAHTVADGKRIARVVDEAGVVFCVGHSARLLGASRKMKELVESRALGTVVHAEGNWSNERGLELTPAMWRYHSAYAPGGPVTQLLVHHFDTVQYILGRITEVQAYVKRICTAAEVEDVAAIISQFENGGLGYFGSSWVSPGIYWINLYGTEANLYHELDFRYWTSPDVDRHTTLARHAHGTSERQNVEVPIKDMFRDELEDFARAIRSGGKPEVGANEAMQALAVVEAVVRSNQERRPVTTAEVLA